MRRFGALRHVCLVVLVCVVGVIRGASESVSLEVAGVGRLRVDPGVEPADVVEAFAEEARSQGVNVTLGDMERMLEYFCELVPCARSFHSERLTVRVGGVGTLTLEPWKEPAAGVEELAKSAADAGLPLSDETMEAVFRAVCEQRRCHRLLSKRLYLNVTSVGVLVVEPWDDPAAAIERWAAAAVMAGHDVSEGGMHALYDWTCERRACGRSITRALTLNATGVGVVTCLPYEEPATAVERLLSAAVDAGVSVPQTLVADMMAWFCARRSCGRPASGMTLQVRGVGTLEVPVWVEPAAAVESFARQAHEQGLDVPDDLLNDMLAWYCARRSCRRGFRPAITAQVETFGTITLPSWRDPADAVEDFGQKVHEKGQIISAETITKLMEFFCARRTCERLQIAAPWLLQTPPDGDAPRDARADPVDADVAPPPTPNVPRRFPGSSVIHGPKRI